MIPELVKEITIWSQRHDLFEKVIELTKQVEAMYNQINIISAQSIIQEGNAQIRVRQAIVYQLILNSFPIAFFNF